METTGSGLRFDAGSGRVGTVGGSGSCRNGGAAGATGGEHRRTVVSGGADVCPAASTPAPAARSAAPASGGDAEAGTTIIGDHESPIGLYLTPWKNEYAERGMDRPARIVQETLGPIDQDVFHRQVEYYDTITAYRKAELAATKK